MVLFYIKNIVHNEVTLKEYAKQYQLVLLFVLYPGNCNFFEEPKLYLNLN